MNRVIAFLTRLRVLDTRSSMVRVVVWTVAWVLVIGHVVTPLAPRYAERPTPADDPPTAVRYVAPSAQTDLAGFLPPPHDPNAFTIAWIGGSETKLNGVSVPGELSRRASTATTWWRRARSTPTSRCAPPSSRRPTPS